MTLTVMPISVFIIDQERTFADALAIRLDAESDMQVVAVVVPANGGIPVPLSIAGSHAGILLLDADLPGDAAIRLCAELSGHAEAPLVIMLSTSSGAERLVQAVQAGAAAWVRKDESLDHLLRVIRGVTRGEMWLPPAQMGQVLRLLLQRHDEQRGTGQLLAALTPRERDVLVCLADGAGRRDVAERLHMSVNTVRTHQQNLMAKLGVHRATEAVALTRSHLDRLRPSCGPC